MSKNYRISVVTTDITKSTTIASERRYGGWLAANQGTSAATVLGFEIQPGEAIDMRKEIPIGSTFDTAIPIVINPGGLVRLMRIQAVEI